MGGWVGVGMCLCAEALAGAVGCGVEVRTTGGARALGVVFVTAGACLWWK